MKLRWAILRADSREPLFTARLRTLAGSLDVAAIRVGHAKAGPNRGGRRVLVNDGAGNWRHASDDEAAELMGWWLDWSRDRRMPWLEPQRAGRTPRAEMERVARGEEE